MIDLFKIKEDFSFLVKEAEPWTLTQFVMWLDLKLSEFKTKGYMILDHNIKTKPKWLLEDKPNEADYAPAPAPCRTCHSTKSTSREVGQYFSDIHASRPLHHDGSGSRSHSESSHHASMDESENVRGEVGIIDLSHAEAQSRNVQKANTNFRQAPSQNTAVPPSSNFRKGIPQNIPRQRVQTQQKSRPDVITIDGSPTEKMFASSRPEIGRTSTPIVRKAGQLLQKAKNRQALSMGTAIYTSTTSSLTPTFSSSYNAQPRPSLPVSSFALGAPPISAALGAPPVSSVAMSPALNTLINQGAPPSSSAGFSLSAMDSQSLDEIIAETMQSVSSSLSSTLHTSTRQTSQIRPDQQQSNKNLQRQHSYPENTAIVRSSPQPIVGMSISPTTYSAMGDGSLGNQAVPIALHANIDNINRDLSTSQSSGLSTSSPEVKMETDVNRSACLGDSLSSVPQTSAAIDTSLESSLSQSFQDTSHSSVDPTGAPRPGLVDPDTAKAYQMVELVVGSGVYVYEKTITQAFKVGTERDTGTYSGEKMARYLLNVFWSRKDLVGATLSKTGRGKKILNQQIIEAILDFCASNSRHTRGKVRHCLATSITSATCHARQKIKKMMAKQQKSANKT